MARVVCDIDDVLYPCVEEIRQYLGTHVGYNIEDLVDPPTWDLHEHWGIGSAELWEIVGRGVNCGYIFSESAPYPGVEEGMRALKEDGHSIHLVTARCAGRPGEAEAQTAAWLNDWNLPYDSLTFSADKTVIASDYALDDKIENFEALSGWVTDQAFLMDQPWNRGHVTKNRVHNFTEFVEAVRERENLWQRYTISVR